MAWLTLERSFCKVAISEPSDCLVHRTIESGVDLLQLRENYVFVMQVFQLDINKFTCVCTVLKTLDSRNV